MITHICEYKVILVFKFYKTYIHYTPITCVKFRWGLCERQYHK